MKRINRTYIMGVLVMALAAWIGWQTSKMPTRFVTNEPGPKLFPYISAIGMAVCAVLSMIFDAPKEAEKGNQPYLDKAGWTRLIVIIAEAIGFAVCMHLIGFWITAMAGMFVFILTLKGKKKINLVFAILLCVGLGSLCYFGFTQGFHIPLPKGTLWDAIGITMP